MRATAGEEAQVGEKAERAERTRRTRIVFDAAAALRAGGKPAFRPGDVTARLRESGSPFGAWEVRGELSNLRRLGLIALDENAALWRVVDGATFSIDAANRLHAPNGGAG